MSLNGFDKLKSFFFLSLSPFFLFRGGSTRDVLREEKKNGMRVGKRGKNFLGGCCRVGGQWWW